MSNNDRQTSGLCHEWLEENVRGCRWGMMKMECELSRQNRDRINEEWCIVCRRAAVEEHSARFHAAGGCLAGPFCSEKCAFVWLRDDRVTGGDYPPEIIRDVYRQGTELEELDQQSAAEEMFNVQLFPRPA